MLFVGSVLAKILGRDIMHQSAQNLQLLHRRVMYIQLWGSDAGTSDRSNGFRQVGAYWGANGGANTDREGRRKEKEVKRRGEMKEKWETSETERWVNGEVSERCESEVI